MKTYFNKIALFLFVVISCVLLGGCSAEYNLILKDNGLIETNFTIDLTGIEDVKSEKIASALSVYFRQLDVAFEQSTVDLYSKIYNYEELNLTTNEQKVAYILGRNGYIVNNSEIIKNGKKINFQKSFYSLNKSLSRSLTAYYLYFYPSALKYDETTNDIVLSASYNNLMDDIPLSSKLEKEEGTFLAKYIQVANPLYYNGEEPKFLYDYPVVAVSKGATLKEYILKVLDPEGINRENLENELNIIFNFTTPYDRVHSNGNIAQNGNSYTHSWVLGGVDSTITFYRNMARPIWWYVIGIAVGFLIIIIGLIIATIIKNHKKKVGMDALKKIDELANKV